MSLILLHSEQSKLQSFGRSECNRVKFWHNLLYDSFQIVKWCGSHKTRTFNEEQQYIMIFMENKTTNSNSKISNAMKVQKEPSCHWKILEAPDHGQEMKTKVVWPCLNFFWFSNNSTRHSKWNKTCHRDRIARLTGPCPSHKKL